MGITRVVPTALTPLSRTAAPSEEPTPLPGDRSLVLRQALWLASATIVWNVVESGIALTAGISADSIALLGFGIDSLVETTSGVVVAWRVLLELRGLDPEQTERSERIAGRWTGGLLLALAAMVLFEAVRKLLGAGVEAKPSVSGLVLTAVSLTVMPLLGRAKLRVAGRLGSRALRADAFETITCAWLSLTTLGGLALNAVFGWGWADPVAALVLVPLIVREGLEGWRGDCCGCHE